MTDTLFDPARLPARDEYGYTQHPDLEKFMVNVDGKEPADGEDCFLNGDDLRAAGWQPKDVTFEQDATEEQQRRYIDEESPDISYWVPTTPEGDGWLVAAIYPHEDLCACALFVRRLQ